MSRRVAEYPFRVPMGTGAIFAIVIVLLFVIHPYGTVKTPPAKANEPQLVITDATVAAVFSRACANCHSNKTVWPWYSYVPPASWLAERDVKEGRRHFNVSNWETYSSEKKAEILADIARVVANREMPLRQYLILHKEARLSNEDAQAVVSWAGKQRRMVRRDARNEQHISPALIRRRGV